MTTGEKTSLFLRSLLLQSAFGPERCQALGFAWALDPWLVKVWGRDAAALADARARHLACFNTNPYAVGFVLGMACRLEEEAAAAPAAERAARLARATTLKTAASTGLAGAADSFFWGALRQALAFAAVLTALGLYRAGFEAWATAPVALYAAGWNGPALWARWKGLTQGYAGGEKGVLEVCKLPAAEAALKLRLAAIGLGAASVFAALYSTALHENARWLGGLAFLLAAAAPERIGPWGVAGAMGVLRAVWEGGL
ncbi:MAG: PTS system mannose/fructose/sorbose family transporter subunit IID [Elusimicrobiota bacterium]|nr:PTS system mannose/fructose/sorbose family transporter subunit IID [Elusimicrobiota bacterium]